MSIKEDLQRLIRKAEDCGPFPEATPEEREQAAHCLRELARLPEHVHLEIEIHSDLHADVDEPEEEPEDGPPFDHRTLWQKTKTPLAECCYERAMLLLQEAQQLLLQSAIHLGRKE